MLSAKLIVDGEEFDVDIEYWKIGLNEFPMAEIKVKNNTDRFAEIILSKVMCIMFPKNFSK